MNATSSCLRFARCLRVHAVGFSALPYRVATDSNAAHRSAQVTVSLMTIRSMSLFQAGAPCRAPQKKSGTRPDF